MYTWLRNAKQELIYPLLRLYPCVYARLKEERANNKEWDHSHDTRIANAREVHWKLSNLWLIRRFADSGDRSSDKEEAVLLGGLRLTFGQSHQFSGSASLRKNQNMVHLLMLVYLWIKQYSSLSSCNHMQLLHPLPTLALFRHSANSIGTVGSIRVCAVWPNAKSHGGTLVPPIWPALQSSAEPPTGSAVRVACVDQARFVNIGRAFPDQTARHDWEGKVVRKLLSFVEDSSCEMMVCSLPSYSRESLFIPDFATALRAKAVGRR